MYIVPRDKYFGMKTAMALVKELRLEEDDERRGFKVLDSLKMEHHDVVWGYTARCYVYNNLERWFHTRLEENMEEKYYNYRRDAKENAKNLTGEACMWKERPYEFVTDA